jgi:GNAT superfamily N-acetyltransferase
MLVRAPEPAEWALWRELRLRALRDAPDAFLESIAQAEAYDEAVWRSRIAPTPTRDAVVAIADDGTWAGQMVVLLDADPPTLVAVFVDSAYRGDGTAALLLDAVVERAIAASATRLRLQVTEGNDRARRFYERRGFVATGDIELSPGRELPEHEMVLDLGARTL